MILRNFCIKSLHSAFHTGLYTTVRCNSRGVESTIRSKLQAALDTAHLEVINESCTQEGPNTRLRLVVVADKFHGLPMHKRYSLINEILKEEIQAGTHTFSIVAKTPIQWHRSQAAKEFPLSSDSGGPDKQDIKFFFLL